MSQESTLRQILSAKYLPPSEVERLGPDSDLFELLDSVHVLRFAAQLEKTYGIVIEDAEIAELSTLASAARLLARKQPGR